MEVSVGPAVVCLLVEGYAVDARCEEGRVLGGGHLIYLNRYGAERVAEPGGQCGDVVNVDEGPVLTADKEDIAEAFGGDKFSLGQGLVEGQPYSPGLIFLVESAVEAAVRAEIG